MKKFILVLLLMISSIVFADTLPNQTLTPGLTREVSVDELCTTSTKMVRHTSEKIKKDVYSEYKILAKNDPVCTGVSHSCYEIDHLISLELGGADDVKNLWPQLYDGQWNAHDKDKLENKLHQLVCKNQIQLSDAQKCIANNWIECYKQYIKN